MQVSNLSKNMEILNANAKLVRQNLEKIQRNAEAKDSEVVGLVVQIALNQQALLEQHAQLTASMLKLLASKP